MVETIRGADILVEALKAAGVSRVFSLSGNHIMPVYDALLGSGIEIIHTRHEAAAVHMADAWARLSGECGVALVTGGQGHSNAVAALPTALAGEVPVLLLSGHAPLAELGLGAFQELEQARLAAPVCKRATTAAAAERLAEDVAAAIRLARSGRPGPVHLSLPTDVLEARIAPPAARGPAAFARAPMPLAPEAVAAIAAAIAAAERPVLIAPPALCTPAGRAALAVLAARAGLPVVAMESPRGLADPALGAFAEALMEADCVVLLGKALDFTLRFGRPPAIPAAARFVVVEPDAALLARAAGTLGDRLALMAMAGAAEAVDALAAEASPLAPHRNRAWAERLEAAIAYRPPAWAALAGAPAGPIHPATLCHALRPWLAAEDAVLVSDGGEIGQWAQAMLQAPARIINGVAGAIGPSIPFALAARCARPGARILAVMGDGTFGFHMAEFDTAHRHNLPFVAVIGNDARWNAEHQIQLRDYGAGRAHGCELAPGTRYDLAAAALGAHGEFVTRAEDLTPALARAFASGRPACVNVVIEGRPAPVIRKG
jgi:acetolactate synthase-1/2/3 large subunit